MNTISQQEVKTPKNLCKPVTSQHPISLHQYNVLIQMSNLVKSGWRLVVYDFQALYPFIAEAPFFCCQLGRSHFTSNFREEAVCAPFLALSNHESRLSVFQRSIGLQPPRISQRPAIAEFYMKSFALCLCCSQICYLTGIILLGEFQGEVGKFLYLCPKQWRHLFRPLH